MKRGDQIYWRRRIRPLPALLVELYDKPWAARIKYRGQKLIVNRAEIISADTVMANLEAKKKEKELRRLEFIRRKYHWLIVKWEPGMDRLKWREKYGWGCGQKQIIDMLLRLEIIK
jgi:hypothetical protein